MISSLNDAAKNFVSKLILIPEGSSLEDHIHLLETRPSATEAVAAAMEHPLEQCRQRIRNLDLEGKPVKVLQFATKEDCKIITDALKKIEPAYNPNYRPQQAGGLPDPALEASRVPEFAALAPAANSAPEYPPTAREASRIIW